MTFGNGCWLTDFVFADFPFQLMYPTFKRKMEEYSASLLHSLQHLVDIHHPPAAQSAPPQIVKASDDSERFDSLVDVLDHLLERAVCVVFRMDRFFFFLISLTFSGVHAIGYRHG
jgi:hypothetical protein